MPTYLLAFVMTSYNSSEIYFEDDGREIPIRLYVHDRFRDQATFPLEVAKTIMKFFTDYTNISYPLPKLDFVEVNLTCEGMENWGLVTINNNEICYDESSFTSRFLHDVNLALLISHEVSHMWFGNLVTHNWYNDLWLTEGIANYMENEGFKEVFKQEQMFSQMLLTNYETSFNDDEGMPSMNTVVLFPDTYNEVEEQSGEIVYKKGSAILRMLEFVMGENLFRKGMQEHLKKHAYKSATTDDFISVMDNLVPNMRIRSFLESWLFQNRFPLISIYEDAITNSFILKQKNFYRDEDSNEGALYGHKWNVPITYVTNDVNYTNSIVWFDKDMEYLSLPKTKSTKWIKLNNAGDGFYRVKYSVELYRNLVENFLDLDLPNRANLIDESFDMVRREKISCEIIFQLMMKIEDSSEYHAVITNINIINKMTQQFRLADFQCQNQKLSKFTNSILERLYSKLSWNVAESDNFIDRKMRVMILEIMCLRQNPHDKCLADFDQIKKNNIEVHRDVRHIYDGMVKAGKRNATKFKRLKTDCSNHGPKSESVSKYISECSKWVEENL